jgi:DNA mismatch repair protein MutL
MAIRPIPPHLVREIAAGEVVERPANVVKELLENSLDAGAEEIEVFFSMGGIKTILVRDNGVGIPFSELPLALSRYTTSKLDFTSPWENLTTFGFRGEALFSIKESAKLTIISREENSPHGGKITTLPGEEPPPPEPHPHPRGTTVLVEDLFFHLPARRKFLSSPKGEEKRIREVLTLFLLSHPEVGFRIRTEEREKDYPKSSLQERVKEIFPKEEFLFLSLPPPLEGMAILSHPHTSPMKEEVYFFLNRRFVKDPPLKPLFRNLYEGDKGFRVILFLKIPPERIDLHVHPQKLAVRIQEGEKIFSHLYHALKKDLTHLLTPKYHLTLKEKEERSSSLPPLFVKEPTTPYNTPFPEQEPSQGEIPFLAKEEEWRYLTTIQNRYLLFQKGEMVCFLDFHATHERILYEKIRLSLLTSPTSIPLLFPVLFPSPIKKNDLPLLNTLSRWGFVWEEWGEDRYILRGVPSWFTGDPETFLRRIFTIEEEYLSDPLKAFSALYACHNALRTGDTLSPTESLNLLQELLTLQEGATCPHGRPTYRIFTLNDLDRLFGRKP